MENTITLRSVSELLEKNFFIPSYQRGYRWTKQQVEDLLNDIYAFAVKKGKSEKEFYCLQPVVVKQRIWSRDENEIMGWEVVDGQQRLTTLRILLAYLIKVHLKGDPLKSEYGKDVFTIDYETRGRTEQFLIDIREDYDENIDFYHIATAYETIRKWFESKPSPKGVRETIIKTLVYDLGNEHSDGAVQVIWYQIEDEANPIDSFIRINLGKISLTNSELIKALFLQKRNFGTEATTNKEVIQQRQLEIATQWDGIEHALQQDEFWWFLNKRENPVASRIEFLFDLAKAVALRREPTLAEQIGTDRNATFRYFYQRFDKQNDYQAIRDEWAGIMRYFNTVQEWFNNPVWFHYIGFLIFAGGKDEIISLYTALTDDAIQTKDEITGVLKGRIKGHFAKVKWEVDPDGAVAPFLNLTYSNDRRLVKDLLLLFNLEYIIRQSADRPAHIRFPFRAFKEAQWDVEHIDSQTENPLKDRKTQVLWLEYALNDLDGLKVHPDLGGQIEEFIAGNVKKNFDVLYREIVALAGEDKANEEEKDNIGNLALLDVRTNRAYGNALFTTKRKAIIEKDRQGGFIPLCTKNVFLKYFDLNGTSRTHWSPDDIKNYREVIEETLINFLSTKPNYHVKHASISEEV